MTTRSPFTWLRDQYCKPVVYNENGTTYHAVPCVCPGVECPGSHQSMYAPLLPIGAALMLTILIVVVARARERSRKRDTTLQKS